MPDNYHDILAEFVSEAKSSIRVYVGIHLDSEIVEECLRSTKRQLAVELYFHDDLIPSIGGQSFLLSHLYRLRESGASIYATSDFDTQTSIICQRDFDTIMSVDALSKKSSSIMKDDDEHIAFQRVFYKVNGESQEFRTEPEDIAISFTVDNATVIEKTATKINWEVKNAVNIDIDGIGSVPAKGVNTLTLLKDTIICIRASNHKQSKVKALSISAIKEFKLNYDLQFLNPASKQYVSLKEEKNEGIFGVTKGSKLKLVWDAEEADSVMIAPFDLTEKSGEFIFNADQTIEVSIQTSSQGRHKTSRVIIHEFPMPVFKHKLETIENKFLPDVTIASHDFRPQATDFLNNKGYLNYNSFATEMMQKAKTYEKELIAVYNKKDFISFYERHSIPKLNHTVKARLRQYFKSKPSVLSMIDSIRNYYE